MRPLDYLIIDSCVRVLSSRYKERQSISHLSFDSSNANKNNCLLCIASALHANMKGILRVIFGTSKIGHFQFFFYSRVREDTNILLTASYSPYMG